MATRVKQLSFLISLGILFLFAACTDQRPKGGSNLNSYFSQGIAAVSTIRFQNKDTFAYQMVSQGNSLYLTGTPFGFARFDGDPESPQLTYAQSDNITQFSPYAWRPDWYGVNALGMIGPYAFMSGTLGTSIIYTGTVNAANEVARYPLPQGNQLVPPSDPNFQYAAVAVNPTLPIVYAARSQDYVNTINANSPTQLQIISKDAYVPNSSVCCVKGAAVFQNRLFIGFQSQLRVYNLGSDGRLGTFSVLSYPATHIVATANHLYIEMDPSASYAGTPVTRGISVFDTNGNFLTVLPMNTQQGFAVTQDDSHLYSNSLDGTSISVYRIR